MRINPITTEIEQYLLNAWKTKTLSQMCAEKRINFSTLHVWFKKRGIEPITQRDLITKEIILMHEAGITLKYRPIAEHLKCSQILVKGIIEELGYLADTPMKRGPAPRAVQPEKIKDEQELRQMAKMRAYKAHEQETKKRRLQYAIYDQSGSELLDSLRNINTTKREKTLSTNGRL